MRVTKTARKRTIFKYHLYTIMVVCFLHRPVYTHKHYKHDNLKRNKRISGQNFFFIIIYTYNVHCTRKYYDVLYILYYLFYSINLGN